MKDNFFIKFKNCLHRIDLFPKYIEYGVARAIGYGFILCIIFGGILGIYGSFIANQSIDKTVQKIQQPEYAFNVKNDTLTMKKSPITLKDSGNLFYISDKKNMSDADSIMNENLGSNSYMLLLKDGIVISAGGYTKDYKYGQLTEGLFGTNDVTNSNLVSKIGVWKKYYFAFVTGFSIFERFINLIMDSFAVTLVGLIVSLLLGMVVKPRALYSLSIYAATVPFLVSLPVSILYPNISLQMPILIGTAIYVAIVLKNIKGNLVQKKDKKNNNKKDLSRFL